MNPIFETDFWAKRLKEAIELGVLAHAIGQGFNFKLIDKIHKEIIKKENVEGKILDFGCGYGRIADWFAEKNYVGVDFFPEFIVRALQMYPLKKFVIGDIRKLPFSEKEFDWGIGVSMKEMIRRDAGTEIWDDCRGELLRVCKKLLILEYGNNREEEIKKYEIYDDQGMQSLSI